MAYSNFKILDIRQKFGIRTRIVRLFEQIAPAAPSEWLIQTLSVYPELSVFSEKARSEWLIAPILTEVWKQTGKKFGIHSGVNLEADAEQGLNGECDFILTARPEKSYFLTAPVVAVVEAKKNDFVNGIPQCAAQLIGARIFNRLDAGGEISLEPVFGAVTDGTEWLFMKLEDNFLYVDTLSYEIAGGGLPQILGIWKHILNICMQNQVE
jgi:hypothetical protein